MRASLATIVVLALAGAYFGARAQSCDPGSCIGMMGL
jgi:hypothetical protein